MRATPTIASWRKTKDRFYLDQTVKRNRRSVFQHSYFLVDALHCKSKKEHRPGVARLAESLRKHSGRGRSRRRHSRCGHVRSRANTNGFDDGRSHGRQSQERREDIAGATLPLCVPTPQRLLGLRPWYVSARMWRARSKSRATDERETQGTGNQTPGHLVWRAAIEMNHRVRESDGTA